MSNEKPPTAPSHGGPPAIVDETAAEPVDPAHQIAPPAKSERAPSPNGAGRRTIVRKIKNYLN
jgi:hypothetical protein